ncbi:hypothetical protein BDR22DRAFT_962531 [Usnea florida]
MKAFTVIAALIAVAGLSHAAPAPVPTLTPCSGCIHLDINATFLGAGPDPPSYTETFTTNTGVFVISNPLDYLSVSHISITGDDVTCEFFGADGSDTTVTNPAGSASTTVDVGPPQPQVSGQCV